MTEPMEIERKYLICRPDARALRGAPYTDIVQTYLEVRSGYTDRVRMRASQEGAVYTRTIKTRVSDMSNIERESVITRGEYEALLSRADPRRAPIRKRRYALSHAGHIFEIDLYPFWQKQAVMEVELSSEDESAPLPPGIRILREVTGLREYGNAALSLNILPEDGDENAQAEAGVE